MINCRTGVSSAKADVPPVISNSSISIELMENGASGIFESMRAYNGMIFKLDEHLNRLFASANSIGFKMPYRKKILAGLIKEKLAECHIENTYIRVSICAENVEIIVKKFVPYPLEYYENGVKVMTSAVRRDFPKDILSNVKSSNFLWGILAKIDGMNQKPFEVLILNHEGHLTEGSVSNVFILKAGIILTPPVYSGLLKGITRGVVIELAEKCGLKVLETPITRHDVYNAAEVFLTNTSIEVMPVVSVDKRVISDGKPGSITKKLLDEFRKVTTKRRL
ncbi:MAG: aminotransferase class IV [Candidatus Omnitrophica bacterium]|nr:aminotransferase class IV [Candidatus Omnitrophota bacterium]